MAKSEAKIEINCVDLMLYQHRRRNRGGGGGGGGARGPYPPPLFEADTPCAKQNCELIDSLSVIAFCQF